MEDKKIVVQKWFSGCIHRAETLSLTTELNLIKKSSGIFDKDGSNDDIIKNLTKANSTIADKNLKIDIEELIGFLTPIVTPEG